MGGAVDTVALQARWWPDRLAAIDLGTGRSWSYTQLDRDIAACVRVLHDRGITGGDRVAALSRNRTLLVILHHACARLGAIYVPLNWRLSPPELDVMIADAAPALLIDDGENRGDVPAMTVEALEAAIAAAAPMATAPVDIEAVSLILYTSGTSGTPKGVMLSERAIAETAINLSQLGAIGRDSRFLCDSPMFHVIGIVSNVRSVLLWGGALLVSDGFVPARTLARLSDPALAITHYFGVPQMMAMLRAEPAFDPVPLRRLTGLFTGGAPHAPADVAAWVGDGIALSNGFGMSECGTVCHTSLDPRQTLLHAGSVGLPTPRTQVRIVDAAGLDVVDPAAGELLIKGANLFSGYWRRPEETAAAFVADGWFRSGDIAKRDDSGCLWIVDRKKDMFISGGENVYPAEIEAAVAEIAQVVEAAVVGVPDDRWGEVGHLAIVLAGAAEIGVEDVRHRLSRRLAPYKLPKYIDIVDALPRTGSGKVQKQRLRAMLMGHDDGANSCSVAPVEA